MDSQPHVVELLQREDDDYQEYERVQRRRTLFRVLANNLVRELQNSGYHGRDLIGFINHLMQAVTEKGFGEAPGDSKPVERDMPALELSTDQWGRPSMTGSRVVLRPPAEGDRAALEEWRVDPLVLRSLALPLLEHIVGNLTDGPPSDRVDLIACERESGTQFGVVSLFNIDSEVKQAEVAKMIGDPGFRGKGFAGAATLLLLRYGFETLALNRVYLRTLGGNLGNIRLNERMGFRFEGVLREAFVQEDGPTDVVLMALLRHGFDELHLREGRDGSPQAE